jgi:penicillin G amidase
MSPVFRVLRRFLALVIVLIVLIAGAIWIRLWRATPQVSGSILLPGPSARVDVLRDADGVPHIRATTEADAMFGLGVVHAQDRLWQMEFQRRLGRGRLAEILGPDALRTDRFFRVLGLDHVAADNWPHLDAGTRALADAYLAGVNGWIAHLVPSTLPVEFTLLGVRPEPFTREDLVVWSKVMALGLSTNWRDELLRARIVGRLGEDAAAMLMPPYTAGGPIIVPEGVGPTVRTQKSTSASRTAAPAVSDRTLAALMHAAPDVASGIAASNNWVLHGTRTATGKPILANDPHLGARIPSVWYLAHVSGGTLDAIGATLPGLPGIVIGHNQRVAWGATNLMTDVEDFFVERVNARQEALYRGQWEPMRVRRESIKVKGAPDEVLVVRSTRHGPLVSDILPGSTEALALRWTALDPVDRTLDAFLGVNVARNWEDFTTALSHLHAPMQNFVYADVDGNIGYFAPGAIPIRPRAGGTLPVPGWTGEDDWTGYVPLDRVPRAFNPARGFVVTANNQALPDDYPYVISTNYEPGYRAARIIAMIEERPAQTGDDVARMQGDVLSAQVAVLRPWLLRGESHGNGAADAKARLAQWDGAVRADSAASALFEAWKGAAARRIFADELGGDLWQEYDQAPSWKAKALHAVAGLGESAWCDDVTTEPHEMCAAVLGLALDDALRDGAARFGSADVASWRWGAGNTVVFPHLPFEFSALLRPLFSRRVETGGDDVTVNPVMRVRDETIVSSYRQIVDLANLDASRFNNTVGQSGQLLGGHYDDLLDKWRKVEHVPMRFSSAVVDRSVKTRLAITPR